MCNKEKHWRGIRHEYANLISSELLGCIRVIVFPVRHCGGFSSGLLEIYYLGFTRMSGIGKEVNADGEKERDHHLLDFKLRIKIKEKHKPMERTDGPTCYKVNEK